MNQEITFLGRLVVALAPAVYAQHSEASNERIAELTLDMAEVICAASLKRSLPEFPPISYEPANAREVL